MKGMGLLVLLVVAAACPAPVDASSESVVTLNDLTIAIHGVAVALTDEARTGGIARAITRSS
jgi:hypothetical protein